MKNREPHLESKTDLLNEDLLWGTPRTSDGAFLVAIRGRLSNQVSGLWLSARKTLAMAGAAATLLIGVWLPGQNSGLRISDAAAPADLSNTVEEFVVIDADPLELADYLSEDVDFVLEETRDFVDQPITVDEPSSSEETATIEESVTLADVSTDEILELDDQDFDLVIAEIQETEFF